MMVFLVMIACALGVAGILLLLKETPSTGNDDGRLVASDAPQEPIESSEREKPVVMPEPQTIVQTEESNNVTVPQEPDPFPATPEVVEVVEVIEETDTGTRFDNEPVLVLIGLQATHSENLKRDADLLERAMMENAWSDYRLLLERSLQQSMEVMADALRRNGYDALWNEQAFFQAMLRWKVLETMPLDHIRTAQRDASEMLHGFMSSNAKMQEWLLTIRPQDDLPRVVAILHDIRYNAPDGFDPYFNLALACGVVFDREVRIDHPLQSEGSAAQTTIDPVDRFQWYVEKHEAGRLAAPIQRMDARELAWVVSTPVATSEMEWAIQRMRLRRNRWGDAFGSINYLMERAVHGINPYEEYSFAEILKHGGICGDQSYFCANTARANGIPAMILTGTTPDGPHAWVALKPKADEWDTTIGRISGTSNGTTRHPQTGEQLTEQEVWLWNERNFRDSGTLATIFRYHWIADLIKRTTGDSELAEIAIRQANRDGRSVPETWSRLADLLAKKTREAPDPGAKPILDMWTRFSSDMKSQFRDNPRMASLAAEIDDEFVFPHLDQNDARRTLARERRRIERQAGEQKDLLATSLKREADLIAGRGEDDALPQISQLYKRALRDHGDDITSFRMMAQEYFSFMKDEPDLARDAVRDIELAFNRVVYTGTTEWFRAETEVSVQRMIAGYYRDAGDESRAQSLERRLERQMRGAERRAPRE